MRVRANFVVLSTIPSNVLSRFGTFLERCRTFGLQTTFRTKRNTMQECVVDAVENEVFDGPLSLSNVNRELGAHPHGQHVLRAWKNLCGVVNDTVDAVDEMDTIMDRIGYVLPAIDCFHDGRPYFGDSVTREHMRPHIEEFSKIYVDASTFMTRKGQRSQNVVHRELDADTGCTLTQLVARMYRKQDRKRKREEKEARERIRLDKISRLEDTVRLCQDELTSLGHQR